MTFDVEWLRQIVEQDEFGLLVAPVKQAPPTADERLVSSFKEICAFIEKHGRQPANTPADVNEFQLFHRLQGFLNDRNSWESLAPHDVYGLLAETVPESLDEIVATDSFGILDGSSEAVEIFTLRHVPAEKTVPDQIAERQPCVDFEKYEDLFKQCHADLRSGRRTLIPFRAGATPITEKSFYVTGGILAYVDEIPDGGFDPAGRRNPRIRCIYENGTESDLFLLSLQRALYNEGRAVTRPNDEIISAMGLEVDVAMGEIYVLQSLSPDRQVQAIPYLHKIGYTKATTENRIAHAEQQRTYLNAPVKVIATYQAPLSAISQYEALLHRFFGSAQITVEYQQGGETMTTANEWFSVPLTVIDEAIELLNAGTITNYEYDRETRTIRLQR